MDDEKEVHDEAQRVAMTAAAAGTRVVETVAREVRERVDRGRAQTERRTEQLQAETALRTLGKADGWDAARPDREAARAHMTPEAREAYRVADLSTGTDPALAAATGRKVAGKPAPVQQPVKVPEIAAGR